AGLNAGAANNNVATSIPTFIFIIYTPTTKDMNHGKYFTGADWRQQGRDKKSYVKKNAPTTNAGRALRLCSVTTATRRSNLLLLQQEFN
ncbi:MAG: hypothetical protein ACRC8G_03920, partial [Plesiomonas shigelloides]